MYVAGGSLLQGMLYVIWSNTVAGTNIFRGNNGRRINTQLFYIRSTAGFSAQISASLRGKSFIECCSECMANKKCAGILYDQSCHLLNSSAGIRQQTDGTGSVKVVILGTYPDNTVRLSACKGNPQGGSAVYSRPYVPPAQRYDCLWWYRQGYVWDGLYCINPVGTGAFWCYCDMSRDGGGWTVIQRRVDGSVDFYRKWADYAVGFGDLDGNMWIGLERLHAMTSAYDTELHVYLETFQDTSAFARYGLFKVGDSASKYVLTASKYSGTAGNGLGRHNGDRFSTRDRDHDIYVLKCAYVYHGAWWYDKCLASCLNGLYYHSQRPPKPNRGINWAPFKGQYYSYRGAVMKIRRLN